MMWQIHLARSNDEPAVDALLLFSPTQLTNLLSGGTSRHPRGLLKMPSYTNQILCLLSQVNHHLYNVDDCWLVGY